MNATKLINEVTETINDSINVSASNMTALINSNNLLVNMLKLYTKVIPEEGRESYEMVLNCLDEQNKLINGNSENIHQLCDKLRNVLHMANIEVVKLGGIIEKEGLAIVGENGRESVIN